MQRRRSTLCLTLSLVAGTMLVWPAAAPAADKEPVRLIFDTDLCSDVDDAGTVALLHALADQGEVELLAMGLSVKSQWSAPCLDALNTYYNRPDIPIGALKGPGIDDVCTYGEKVAAEFPHDLKSADDAPDVVEVYRSVLAKQPDKSVVFVSVGFLTNLANLLESKADSHSPLNGVELVRQKVRSWVCMGGGFPSGREYNFHKDAKSAEHAVKNWPTPIVFSGFEIGESVQTGAGLKSTPASNPVRRAYEVYNGLNNRSSWDQTAALFAVRGPTDMWDLREHGDIGLAADGSNAWHDQPDRGHSFLVRKMSSDKVAERIEQLMEQLPKATAK